MSMDERLKERIDLLQKDIMADQTLIVDDRVVDLLELLYKRIDELEVQLEDYDAEQQREDDRYHYDRNDLD